MATTNPEIPKRITVQEIMARLCVGEATVYDLLRRHEIPALRINRNWIISRYAYERWERGFGRPEEGVAKEPAENKPEVPSANGWTKHIPSPGAPVFTYFIFDRVSGHVKIGRSIDPVSRLHGLQSAQPERLELLGTLEGDVEREWHREFQSARVSGEWFALTPELASALMGRVGIASLRVAPEAVA